MQQYRSNSYLFGGNAPTSRNCTRPTSTTRAACPTTGAPTSTSCRTCPSSDGTLSRDVAHAPVVESFAQRAKANAFALKASASELAVARKQVHVQSLIAAYRSLGARWADLDPLKRTEAAQDPRARAGVLRPRPKVRHGHHVQRHQHLLHDRPSSMTLREILQALRETYCGTIGAEFMHITEPTEKRWWQERLESIRSKPSFSSEQKKSTSSTRSPRPRASSASCTPSTSARSASRSKAARASSPAMDELVQRAGAKGVQEDRDRHGPPRPPRTCWSTRWARCPRTCSPSSTTRRPRICRPATSSTTRASRATSPRPGGPVHLSLAFNPRTWKSSTRWSRAR